MMTLRFRDGIFEWKNILNVRVDEIEVIFYYLRVIEAIRSD